MAKFYSRNAPPRAIQQDQNCPSAGELIKPAAGRWCVELNEELGIEATVGEYVASHGRKFGADYHHLHAWHVPDFHGTLRAHEHESALVRIT